LQRIKGAWEERSREKWKSEASGVETNASVQSVGAGSGVARAAVALERMQRCYGRRRWWSWRAGNRRSIGRPVRKGEATRSRWPPVRQGRGSSSGGVDLAEGGGAARRREEEAARVGLGAVTRRE
jgi:hypothetical protein